MEINITDVFGWTAASFSIILYISPFSKYLQLCKNKIRFNDTPNLTVLTNYITGINWFIYAYMIKNLPLCICYLAACFFSIIFTMTFLLYLAKVKLLKALIFTLILLLYTLIMYLLLAVLIRNINIIGYISIAFSFITLFYPITLIKNVIKFRNYKFIPIKLCVVNLIATTCWIIYGFMIVNFLIIIPNFIGMIFTFIIMFIWNIFKKRKPISEDSNFSFSKNRPETTVNVI
jgi:solute carrier family 50 protein (sugar transporter)